MTYVHLKADGTTVEIVTKRPLRLKRLQALVGGYIESVPLHGGFTLMVNEEGLIHNLPRNPHIQQHQIYVDISYGLRGDVVLGRTDDEGNFVGIEPLLYPFDLEEAPK